MNEVLIASLGGVGALIIWGASDWFTGRSSRQFSGPVTNVAIQIVNAAVLLFLLFVSGVAWPTLAQTGTIVLTAAFFTGAYLCFIRALSTGKTGVVVPLANTYPLITILLIFALTATVFTGLQTLALIIIGCAAILLGAEKLSEMRVVRRPSKEVIYACLTALFWGVGYFAIGSVVNDVAWQAILGIMGLAMAAFAVVIFAVQNKRHAASQLPQIWHNRTGLIAGLLLALGAVPFYVGAEAAGNILIPTVIAAASPLFTSLLAFLFDQEKLAPSKRIGAVLTVIGVVFLNL